MRPLTSNLGSPSGGYVIHDHMALVHLIAVAAAAVDLAEVVDGEAGHGKGATALSIFSSAYAPPPPSHFSLVSFQAVTTHIMLQHLILRPKRTTPANRRRLPRLLLLHRKRILTHRAPPHIRHRARAKAVHAFQLVGPDNAVRQGCAILKHEHCIAIPALAFTAADAAIVRHHPAVERLARRDRLGGAKDRGAGGGWEAAAGGEVAAWDCSGGGSGGCGRGCCSRGGSGG